MYVSKQNTNELIIQSKKPTLRDCLNIFALIVILSFFVFTFLLTLLLQFLSPLGSLTLACNRVEPTLVECEYTRDELLGLVKEPTTKTGLTKEAKLNSETKTGSDDDTYTVYSVTLISVDGRANILHESSNHNFLHESSNHNAYNAIYALTSEINSFINSNEPSLILERSDWELEAARPNIFYSILLMYFTVIFTYTLISSIRVLRIMIISRNKKIKSRIFNLNKLTNSFNYKDGDKIKQYKLDQITKIEQKEYKSDDKSKSYQLKLVLSSGESHMLLSTNEQVEANFVKLVKREIEDFIPQIRS